MSHVGKTSAFISTLALVSTFGLVACGGGGGSSPTSSAATASPPPPPPPVSPPPPVQSSVDVVEVNGGQTAVIGSGAWGTQTSVLVSCTTTPADAPIRWVDIDGVVYDDPAARETNISSAPDLGIDVQPECQLADGSDSLAGETVVINSRFEDTVINLSPELFAGHVTSNNEETCFGPIQNSNGPITAQIDSELNILSVINQYDFDTNTGVCITESVADTQDQPDVVMGKSYYDPTRQGASPALDGGGSPIVLFGPLQLDQEVQLSNSIFLIGPATQSGGLGSPNVLQGAQVALGNGESLTTSIDDTDCLVTESRRFTARFCQDVDGMIVFDR